MCSDWFIFPHILVYLSCGCLLCIVFVYGFSVDSLYTKNWPNVKPKKVRNTLVLWENVSYVMSSWMHPSHKMLMHFALATVYCRLGINIYMHHLPPPAAAVYHGITETYIFFYVQTRRYYRLTWGNRFKGSHPTFSRLTHGGEVVSFVHQPSFTPRKIPGTHFCQRLSQPQGHSAVGIKWPHQESDPWCSNSQHSASTYYTAICPRMYYAN
jgi:hypothetical protein